jgi:hypothetical protein
MTIDATQSTQNRSQILLAPENLDAEFGGDPNATLAVLMLAHARDVRDGARDTRAAEERNLEAQEDRQVQAMHEQADDTRWAGWVGGATEIGAGVLQTYAGSMTMTGATNPKTGEITAEVNGSVLKVNGYGELVKGAGNVGSSLLKAEGEDADADGTAAGHRAQASIRRLDDIKETEKDARELARTAIDFYRDQTRSKTDADHATLFLRG